MDSSGKMFLIESSGIGGGGFGNASHFVSVMFAWLPTLPHVWLEEKADSVGRDAEVIKSDLCLVAIDDDREGTSKRHNGRKIDETGGNLASFLVAQNILQIREGISVQSEGVPASWLELEIARKCHGLPLAGNRQRLDGLGLTLPTEAHHVELALRTSGSVVIRKTHRDTATEIGQHEVDAGTQTSAGVQSRAEVLEKKHFVANGTRFGHEMAAVHAELSAVHGVGIPQHRIGDTGKIRVLPVEIILEGFRAGGRQTQKQANERVEKWSFAAVGECFHEL